MGGLWRNDPGTRGGKYLVQRRDGSVPGWPYFVLGAADPVAPWALRVYALAGFLFRLDRRYLREVWALAQEFDDYRRAFGSGKPDAPRTPGLRDDPAVVGKMMHGA